MQCGALGENQLFLRKFRYGVYMFTNNVSQNIVVKWSFRTVEKRVHERVNTFRHSKQTKLELFFYILF